jgi:two-component system response regulator VicR
MKEKSLTTKDVAHYCQVTQRTAVQWINEGKLKFFRTLGKHIRINRKDFIEFLKQYGMPIPEELMMPSNPDRKKKILIVDDDPGMVDSILRFLIAGKTYDLETARDGFEAGQKFSDFKPDLLILDIKMPGMDGYQVCSRIRKSQENNNVKILFISGTIDRKEIERIRKTEADDYLAKPFTSQALEEKIHALFGWTRRLEDKKAE